MRMLCITLHSLHSVVTNCVSNVRQCGDNVDSTPQCGDNGSKIQMGANTQCCCWYCFTKRVRVHNDDDDDNDDNDDNDDDDDHIISWESLSW